MLKAFNVFLPTEHITILKKIGEISVAEHIRRAIEAYIEDMQTQSSVSPSKK